MNIDFPTIIVQCARKTNQHEIRASHVDNFIRIDRVKNSLDRNFIIDEQKDPSQHKLRGFKKHPSKKKFWKRLMRDCE